MTGIVPGLSFFIATIAWMRASTYFCITSLCSLAYFFVTMVQFSTAGTFCAARSMITLYPALNSAAVSGGWPGPA